MGIRQGRKERILVLTVAVSVLILVYHRYYLSPLLAEIRALREELGENRERLGGLKATGNEAEYLLKDIESIKTRICELEVLVPQNPDAPGIIAHMEAFSKAAGVELLSIDFDGGFASGIESEGSMMKRGCLEIPVQVFISGTYENIIGFLEQLEGWERMCSITGFDIFTAQPEDKGVLDMKIYLCAYALLPGEQAAGETAGHYFMEQEYGRDNPFRPMRY
jgi:Tfp pilus assembly protein PilO